MNDYYKAYDKRYKQVHSNNLLWTTTKPTKEVLTFLNKYNCQKNDLILELGCGEGRDAIYLLENGYKLIAVDYSINALNKCNELTNNMYKDSFKQLDLIKDKLNLKFKYIYSIAVLHMFVTDNHRNQYFKFIKEHLSKDGIALITMLGDGISESKTDINKAFDNTKRIVMNNNKELNIATTSCRIVNFKTLEDELKRNNLIIREKWISTNIPEFTSSMCIEISNDND